MGGLHVAKVEAAHFRIGAAAGRSGWPGCRLDALGHGQAMKRLGSGVDADRTGGLGGLADESFRTAVAG